VHLRVLTTLQARRQLIGGLVQDLAGALDGPVELTPEYFERKKLLFYRSNAY